jgi:hypothetical protein
VLPAVPEVSAGWALRSGDFLVSSGDGVQIVRNGVVAARPVTSPVEAAIADGSGAIVFVTPHEDLYPDQWPDLDRGGGYLLWRAHPDGVVEELLRTGPITIDGPRGLLTLYQAAPVFDPLRPFVFFKTSDADESPLMPDRLGYLFRPQNGSDWPPSLYGGTRIQGVGWQNDADRFVVVASEGGETWFSVIGIPTAQDWPSNPIPRGTPCPDDPDVYDCLDSVTSLPGTSLIAYTITDAARTKTDLVIYNTELATEVVRLRIAEAPNFVKQLHASDTQVVVSLMESDEGFYRHLPGLVVDIAVIDDPAIGTLPVPGVATIVP